MKTAKMFFGAILLAAGSLAYAEDSLTQRCPEVEQAEKLPCTEPSSCSTKLKETEKAHEICMERLKPKPDPVPQIDS